MTTLLRHIILSIPRGQLPAALAFFAAAGVPATSHSAAFSVGPASGARLVLAERDDAPTAPAAIVSLRVRAPQTLDALVPALLAPALGASLEGAILRRPRETVATLSLAAVPGALFAFVETDEEDGGTGTATDLKKKS